MYTVGNRLRISLFGRSHADCNHKVQFRNEIRIAAILIEHKVFRAPRTVNVPECFAGEVLHFPPVLGLF